MHKALSGHLQDVSVRARVPVPMRDGTVLITDLYLPKGRVKVPTILYRTPYSSLAPLFVHTAFELARCGFAVILQNCRGRYGSGGEFVPFEHEQSDGYDTVAWFTEQPWFDGHLGLLGASYATYAGTAIVKGRLPEGVRVKAMVSMAGIMNPYHAVYMEPSILTLHWAVPFITTIITGNRQKPSSLDWKEIFKTFPDPRWEATVSPSLRQFGRNVLTHREMGPFWHELDTRCPAVARIPTLHISGWYDFLLPLTLSDYQTMVRTYAAGGQHHLIVGPWDHRTLLMALARTAMPRVPMPGIDKYPTLHDGGFDLLAEIQQWFLRWIRPELAEKCENPQVRIFVMGDERWETLSDWPPPGAAKSYLYLQSTDAHSRRGDGALVREPPQQVHSDTVDHNVDSPVPSVGGRLWPIQYLQPGPLDQSAIEDRLDVLVYTSPPLEFPLSLLGPVGAVLWVKSNKPVYGVAVKLVDLHPSGYAQIVTEGIARLGTDVVEPTVTQVCVNLAATAHTFLPGHNLRLEIATSNFPKYEMIREPYCLTVHNGLPFPSLLEFTLASTPSNEHCKPRL